jgi:hypothetical protein
MNEIASKSGTGISLSLSLSLSLSPLSSQPFEEKAVGKEQSPIQVAYTGSTTRQKSRVVP